MKKIVCELCEGMEFVKDGGMFTCQGCGTKYTAEEAKAMMREVDGAAPAAAPAAPAAPVGNPMQAQIDNMLLLASNAEDAGNNQEAENYCNQIIALDAKCYKAWFIKGKAAGWQSTLKKQRITEAAHAFAQAIDFAPEEEKEELKEKAIAELKRLGLACIALRKDRFSSYPDSEELNGFTEDRKTLLDALLVLLSKGIAARIPEGYEEEIANMMNLAAVAAFTKIREKYNDDNRPMPNDFKKALEEADNCRQLIISAIDASDDDDEEDITRYENLIIIVEFTINMTAYPDYSSSSWRSWMLTDESKATRKRWVEDYKKKIRDIKKRVAAKKKEEEKKAEAERLARIAAYWEVNAEKKAALDAELAELNEKKAACEAEIAELGKQISDAQPKGDVPSQVEVNKMSAKIKELEARKANLGIFAGKEKKQIAEEVTSLQGQISALSGKIAAEKKAREEEANAKTAPLSAKIGELEQQITAAAARIDEIEAELTKDR